MILRIICYTIKKRMYIRNPLQKGKRMEENKNPMEDVTETPVVPTEEAPADTEPTEATAENAEAAETPADEGDGRPPLFDPFERPKRDPRVPEAYGMYGVMVPPEETGTETPPTQAGTENGTQVPPTGEQTPPAGAEQNIPLYGMQPPPPPYGYNGGAPGYYGYAPMPGGYPPPPPPKKPTNGKSVTSLVFGIISTTACGGTLLAPVFGVVAIILAILSRNGENRKMDGMAKAGLICGICGIVTFLFVMALIIFGLVLGMVMDGAAPVDPNLGDEIYDIVTYFFTDFR